MTSDRWKARVTSIGHKWPVGVECSDSQAIDHLETMLDPQMAMPNSVLIIEYPHYLQLLTCKNTANKYLHTTHLIFTYLSWAEMLQKVRTIFKALNTNCQIVFHIQVNKILPAQEFLLCFHFLLLCLLTHVNWRGKASCLLSFNFLLWAEWSIVAFIKTYL